VERDAEDDQPDAGQVPHGGDLAEDDQADDGRGGGQQREHEGEGGAGQAGHRQLVGDVGDDRRAHAHADAPQQPRRMGERRSGRDEAERCRAGGGDEHGQAKLIDPAQRQPGGAAAHRGVGDAVPEQDVQHEPRTVGEGEQVPQRLTGELDRGQDGHPADGQQQGEDVAAGPGADGGQDDRAQELDRAHRRQRQPVDGEVEQHVHRGKHGAQAGEHQPLTGAGRGEDAPGTAPQGEHHRGRGDPQPGHPGRRDMGEQQHGQGRAEVMEHRADHEERCGRHPGDRARDRPGRAGPARSRIGCGHTGYPPVEAPRGLWQIEGTTRHLPSN
jgi:hypothetical protein